MGAVNHALTATSDFLQQFILAKVAEYSCGSRSLCQRISIEGGIYSSGRRFTGGGEQFCPRLVGRFDKSGHFESRAGLKRLDGRDGF
jgi:hypothetical protein